MRKLALLLMLGLILGAATFAQKKSKIPPSAQKEMDKAMAELEREDPEMAKQIKSMMSSSNPSTASKKKPPPVKKFVSPAIAIKLKTSVTPPTLAQAKDFLLWYRGKKVNDSILIQTDGSLIKYQKNRNRVIVQRPANKKPFKTILPAFEKSETFSNGLITFFC